MAAWTHDLIVIGGGAAGLSTASGCSQLGMKTALVEPHRMGGDCLYYGCVPSKSLLRTAAVARGIRDAGDFGLSVSALPRGEGGPADYKPIAERIRGIIGAIAPHDSPDRFRSLGVEVFEQGALFSDPHTLVLDDGKRISARSIVLATGSRPRVLPVPGIEEAGYITNIDIFSLESLPSSLAIIGGGPIGVEMGQAMARLGVRVSIIEAAPHILIREDEDMAAIIRERLVKEGVTLVEGVSVEGVSAEAVSGQDAGGLKTLKLSDGSELKAEEILMAAGRVGNTENLNIAASGVEVERGFFKVDDRLRTASCHIMALGDCNGRYLFTHAAGSEASLAVRRLAFHLPGRMDYRALPWVTYTEPELASVGLNEVRAREAGTEYRVVSVEMADNDRARAEGETEGRMKILYDGKKRVLGVQIAGPHAGEMLMPGVFAVSEGWKLGKFLGPVYPYPTVSEMYKSAAGKVLGPALFNDRVRTILRLLFRYRGEGPKEEASHE
jgi:pyruvate/2-oxoglutarate dehydrogenase complex dihydrolipoamide dehydrogenase (E3) component